MLKIFQIDNEKLTDEIIQLKKELLCLKNKNPNLKENNNNTLDQKFLEMEKKFQKLTMRLEKTQHNLKNKADQNSAMISLLKVMKQEIAFLVNCLTYHNLYTGDVATKLKELKGEEHKALHGIQKFAEEQFSESETEPEDFRIHI